MPASGKMTALARHAAAVRWQKPNIEDTARDLAAERIADYVSRVVASAPPLTPAQRGRIATLLQVGDAA